MQTPVSRLRRRLIRLLGAPILAAGLFVHGAAAQLVTGSIAGVLTDKSGAHMPDARLQLVNQATGQARDTATSDDGRFSIGSLAPGSYRLRIRLQGFKPLEQIVTVETGTVTTADPVLEFGAFTDGTTVSGAQPLLRRDQHEIGGVIGREQIERLPLNGRNFLELAKLEPGIVNPSRLADNRTFVAPLGAGLQTIPRIGYTRVTVDGASVTTPGTLGVLLQVSQDVVQEFEMSTVNFDPATSLTSNGSLNIVTRSGGNQFRASGFSLYRDHRLSAYPALRRDPANPDPFFRREQFGAAGGGPLVKNRAFIFGSYERHAQTGVLSVQPASPDFAPRGNLHDAVPRQSRQRTARFRRRSGQHDLRALLGRRQSCLHQHRTGQQPSLCMVTTQHPGTAVCGLDHQRALTAVGQ